MTDADGTTETWTSVADQSLEQLGGQGSLLVRQRVDHARLDEMLEALPRTVGVEQDALLSRLARLVFPHAYAEETVVWPVLRSVLPDGDELTLRNEQEHQQINELFSELDRTPPDDDRRAVLLGRLTVLLRQDARDEEDLLLPRLQQAVSAEQLRRLGLLWGVVRRTAPTRPHAVVSRRPPGNVLSGAPLAVLDRSRDHLDVAARRAPSLAPVLSTVSRALARAAGLVEHVPALTWGEDPSTRSRRSAST